MKKQGKLLLIIVALFWLSQYVHIPQQTPYLTSLGVGAGAVGIIVGAYGVSQMLLRLPVGLLADWQGRHKRFIVIGVLSAGAGALLRAFFPSGAGFFLANLCSGLASAMWISFMVLYMSYFSQEEQQTATSRLIMVNNLGILLGFLTSTLLYQKLGMRILSGIAAGAGAAAFLLSMGIQEKEPSVKDRHTVGELLAICTNRRLILFAVLTIVQQGIQMSTTMSFTMQILKSLGASAVITGVASILYMCVAVASSGFAGSSFCKKTGARLWVPLVFLLLGCYCVVVPRCTAVWQVLPCQILPGLATGILGSFLTSEAMKEVPKDKKSTAMGFYQAVYAIGMSAFPVLAGYLAQHFDMKAAYLALGGFAFAACAGSLLYFRRQRALTV